MIVKLYPILKAIALAVILVALTGTYVFYGFQPLVILISIPAWMSVYDGVTGPWKL